MRLPKIFHTSIVDVHKAAFWLAFFGILADILGLMRDRLLAGIFGAGRTLDIYYAAFRVPDFLYTLMLFFTASTAIIPIFLQKYNNSKEESEKLLGSIILFFILVLGVLGTISFIMMPYLTKFLLPGFSSADQATAIILSRILLLSPLLLGFSNILSSVTQSFRRFFVYALSPVFYNVGIIVGILFLYQKFGLAGLAWGTALGAFLHMFIQFPSILQLKISPKITNLFNQDLKKVIALSLPRTMGLTMIQIVTSIFTGIASTLSLGSISIFNLASNLQNIPITVIGLSYSVAAFPSLADFSLSRAKDHFKEHFTGAFRHIIFWTVPFSVLFLVLRAQIVRVILGTGNFNWNDTRLTAASLFLLSLAIIFQSLFMLLIRAFYAEGKAWKPLLFNFFSMILSIAGAFIFVSELSSSHGLGIILARMLRISDIPDIRVLALPFGILIGSVVNFFLLFFSFKKIFGWFPTHGSERTISEIFLGSFAGGAASYIALGAFSILFNLHKFSGIFLQGFLAGLIGVFITGIALKILGNREFSEIYLNLKNVFRKKDILASISESGPISEPEKLP